ncbi:MAG: response regulator, partial [Solirubrobacterales bacterium]|nr:response regulator [Solirubrobacterales bacterium]
MRSVLSRALRDGGFDVVGEARDGDEALSLWKQLEPDVMTLDLQMPGTDGIGVLRALREAGRTSVPVVVVSAFSPSHGARAVDALAEGAFDLVCKPAASGGLAAFTAELAAKVAAAVHARR